MDYFTWSNFLINWLIFGHLIEKFDQVKMSSEIRSSDRFPFPPITLLPVAWFRLTSFKNAFLVIMLNHFKIETEIVLGLMEWNRLIYSKQ